MALPISLGVFVAHCYLNNLLIEKHYSKLPCAFAGKKPRVEGLLLEVHILFLGGSNFTAIGPSPYLAGSVSDDGLALMRFSSNLKGIEVCVGFVQVVFGDAGVIAALPSVS